MQNISWNRQRVVIVTSNAVIDTKLIKQHTVSLWKTALSVTPTGTVTKHVDTLEATVMVHCWRNLLGYQWHKEQPNFRMPYIVYTQHTQVTFLCLLSIGLQENSPSSIHKKLAWSTVLLKHISNVHMLNGLITYMVNKVASDLIFHSRFTNWFPYLHKVCKGQLVK